MNNVYPLRDEKENENLHYWWIAHLVDVRIDAYLRTNDTGILAASSEKKPIITIKSKKQ